MVSMASSRVFIGLVAAALLIGFAVPLHAKEFLKGNPDIARQIDQQIRAKINDISIPVEGIEEA